MRKGVDATEATFCFVDVAGFTALTEAHGDVAAADLIERFGELVRQSLLDPGRIVDAVGDAVLVTYPEPQGAVDFAIRLFTCVAREPDFPALRAGLHHGPIVERDGRFFGATLNLAARVTGEARGGQILATKMVAEATRGPGISTVSLGHSRLRNVHEPVELYAIEISGAAGTEIIDPVCRMRVEPDLAQGRLLYRESEYWFCSLECAARFAAAPETYVE